MVLYHVGFFFHPYLDILAMHLLRQRETLQVKYPGYIFIRTKLKSCKGPKLQENNPLFPSNIEWSSSCLFSLTTQLMVINKGLSPEWKVEVEYSEKMY